MIIIPAIDLKNGKCVRLRQGRMEDSTTFNDDPVEQARIWAMQGAERIHVVDLDGSVEGKPSNLETISNIVTSVNVPVQLGGGIRDERVIEMYLKIGISQVILGTIAAKHPEQVISFLQRFTDKLAIGIDARDGIAAVEGWTETTSVSAVDLAAKFDSYRPFAFIYTDIERDGMMKGPNINATVEFSAGVSSPVILSGGVSNYSDLERISALENNKIMGIIIGRALYEKTIELPRAMELVKNAG